MAALELFFSGRHVFEYTTDDHSLGFEPTCRWTRPSVTLAGQGDASGRFLENWQTEPDIKVPNEPCVVDQGRDQ